MSTDNNILDHFFKTTPTNDTPTDELVLIVDRSGSMQRILDDAQGGLDSFLASQRDIGPANVTLVSFDSASEVVWERIPIKEATGYAIRPRGQTALLDAVGQAMNLYRDVQTSGKRIAVILTDGEENASIEWTRDSLLSLITELKEEGWEFVFLAADENAIHDATSWGMSADNSIVYDTNVNGASTAAYAAAGAYTTSIRGGFDKTKALADMDAVIATNDSLKKLI